MKVLIGIQARSGSTRFPGKVFEDLGGASVLQRVYQRCKDVNPLPKAVDVSVKVLATKCDESLVSFAAMYKIPVMAVDCDENDLTARYGEALKGNDGFVRITADCPLVPKQYIEGAICELAKGTDYWTNTSPRTFLDGFDVQAMTARAFYWYSNVIEHEEHLFHALENRSDILSAFMEHGFKVKSFINPEKQILNPFHPDNKLSIDTEEDLKRVRHVMARASQEDTSPEFDWHE